MKGSWGGGRKLHSVQQLIKHFYVQQMFCVKPNPRKPMARSLSHYRCCLIIVLDCNPSGFYLSDVAEVCGASLGWVRGKFAGIPKQNRTLLTL